MRQPEHKPRIAFFTETSQETLHSSLRILEELSRFALVTVSLPGRAPSEAESSPSDSALTLRYRRPYNDSFAGFLARLPAQLVVAHKAIREAVAEADLVISRIPSPIAWMVDRASRRLGRPHLLYVIADIETAAQAGAGGPRSPGRVLRRFAACVVRRQQHRLARDGVVIAIGDALASQYAPVTRRCETFYVSSVREEEIVPRTDTCLSERVELLHVGRLVPLKGTSDLLDALRILRAAGRDVRLTIVGSGPERERLEQISRTFGLTGAVAFLGTLPYDRELFQIFRKADIFVHPSLSESFPRTLWEAMAAHAPIVATDVGDVGAVLREASAGLVAPPQSGPALAEAISRIIDDPALRQSLMRNGGELIRDHTVERSAERLWNLLRTEIPQSAQSSRHDPKPAQAR